MKTFLVVVLAACLAGFVVADEASVNEVASELMGSNTADKLADEPESAQAPMSKEDCMSECDSTNTNPEDEENVNDIKREENTVTKEIEDAKEKVKQAEECVNHLGELKAQLAELQKQKSDLSGESKKTLLENKYDLERRSANHVAMMTDTLKMKLEELQQAEKEMITKNDLTRKALEATTVPGEPAPAPIIEEDSEPIQTALSDELNAIHSGMLNSLDAHSQRVMQMTGDIPGLHDIQQDVKLSKSAKGLAAALDQSGSKGEAAIAAQLKNMGMQMDRGIVTEKGKAEQIAARDAVNAENAKLNSMGSLVQTKELAKLRKTIKKLKKRLH